jgi:hypothetical protein
MNAGLADNRAQARAYVAAVHRYANVDHLLKLPGRNRTEEPHMARIVAAAHDIRRQGRRITDLDHLRIAVRAGHPLADMTRANRAAMAWCDEFTAFAKVLSEDLLTPAVEALLSKWSGDYWGDDDCEDHDRRSGKELPALRNQFRERWAEVAPEHARTGPQSARIGSRSRLVRKGHRSPSITSARDPVDRAMKDLTPQDLDYSSEPDVKVDIVEMFNFFTESADRAVDPEAEDFDDDSSERPPVEFAILAKATGTKLTQEELEQLTEAAGGDLFAMLLAGVQWIKANGITDLLPAARRRAVLLSADPDAPGTHGIDRLMLKSLQLAGEDGWENPETAGLMWAAMERSDATQDEIQ